MKNQSCLVLLQVMMFFWERFILQHLNHLFALLVLFFTLTQEFNYLSLKNMFLKYSTDSTAFQMIALFSLIIVAGIVTDCNVPPSVGCDVRDIHSDVM